MPRAIGRHDIGFGLAVVRGQAWMVAIRDFPGGGLGRSSGDTDCTSVRNAP
jgi:hypothetical protein